MTPSGMGKKRDACDSAQNTVELRLHVAGEAPNSIAAYRNLMQLLSMYPGSKCTVEVVDCMGDPQCAIEDGVLVTPTLVRLSPKPNVRIVGDLSNPHAVARTLGLED